MLFYCFSLLLFENEINQINTQSVNVNVFYKKDEIDL